MANQDKTFRRRLAKVRRRWKAAAALDGALLVATEALGLLLLFMLADAIYSLSGQVRAVMLCAGLAVLAVLFVRHVAGPMVRRIGDEQIALYIEERSARAEGSVISALECQRRPRGGLSGFLAGLLVDDAVHRIDQSSMWRLSNLGRLKKHVLAAGALLALFAVTSVGFPRFARQRGERIIAPWISIAQERVEAETRQREQAARLAEINRPVDIDVQPKGMTILRGKGIEFVAALSRKPPSRPVFHYQFAGGKEQVVEMSDDQARFGYKLPFQDINEPFKYRVTVGTSASPEYEIQVHDPLVVRGIELTYHYPDYLQRDPRTSFGPAGDVTALAGTRVDVKLVANNPIQAGSLKFADGKTVELKPGPTPADGAAGSFSVDKDGSYTYALTDIYGETCRLEDFFFVKAVPDNPPTIAMVSPKVDMSVHPLCEITFAAKVSDDFAIGDVTARVTCYRDGKSTPVPLRMIPAGRNDYRNFLSGRVEHVLELEKMTPPTKVGDMMFYYMEATDRKGQAVKTDLFFIKLMPFEVAASWPADPTPPDLPHWDYLWTPDIILLAAAAWHIEQQRGKIPAAEFNAQCTQLAGRMEPALNSQNGLNLLGGKRKLSDVAAKAGAAILEQANSKLRGALDLLRGYQPGQAAYEMQQAMALAESLDRDKAFQEIEMAQAPIHTGQPSGGYNQDAVMEQAEFRLPSVMSDSLTAFQQEDNPRHFLPPDYRRALRLKERTAPLTKELKLAGEIYASQEQLLEMAREQFGHRKLREAAEMSCTNDPAAGAGTKGQMIRVDKRAVPWSSMDERADLPQLGNRGQMAQPKAEKVKGLQYAKLGDNERAGPGSPHRSQTPGGGASDEDDPDRRAEKDKKKPSDYEWEFTANDRRPRQSQGGGGGGDEQQQRPQTGMQQPQQPQSGGGSSGQAQSGAQQQLAAQQAALAERAAQLARNVAGGSEAGEPMGQRAADGLRDASREMRQASASFQRGDLKTGIAQARRAQQAMRTAMHGMQAAQFGSLGEALAAAQQGAAVITQNQYRVSQGTRRLEERVSELAGGGQGGQGQAGQPQTGEGQDAKRQAGGPGTDQNQAGAAKPGKTQAGAGKSGEQGTGEGGDAERRAGGRGTDQDQAGGAKPGQQQAEGGKSGKSGKSQAGGGKAGEGQARVSGAEVEAAKARDPRVAGAMQGLAGEQLKLSESIKDFDAYVNDLVKWSQEADKQRVTSSLKDVTEGLRRDAVAQRMVDAGVDLSQQEISSARATQGEIEAALEGMAGRLREAGDMLAGSKTGILSRTARQAKDIGREVRRLAGVDGKGEGGEGQDAKRQAGGPGADQARAGGARPGEEQAQAGQPGQGQPGQGQPGQGQPNQGQPGQGQAGQGQSADSLAQRLAAEQEGQMALSTTPGRAGPGANVPGRAGGPRDEIDDLWFKTRDLVETLRDEQLAEPATVDYIDRRVSDPEAFRQMFDKVKKAEAGKFSDVVTGVGKSLDEALKETLAARKLHSERAEECPRQYRSFVDAYFEALSKAATAKAVE